VNTTQFLAPDGTPVPSVTSATMREIDRIAIDETGPNLFQMMEHAGLNLALQTIEVLGADWRARSVVVLAGRGGNGGGGICAARHLASRGVRVTLVLAGPLLTGSVPAFQHAIYGGTAGREATADAVAIERPDLIIDALIGYGLTAAPTGGTADLISWSVSHRAPVLSLDVPSGVDATTGGVPGVVMRPRWTLTLALPKTGLTPRNAGQVVLADLGIPRVTFERAGVPWVSHSVRAPASNWRLRRRQLRTRQLDVPPRAPVTACAARDYFHVGRRSTKERLICH